MLTLVLAAMASAAAAGVFFHVGLTVLQRQVSDHARFAQRAFALWWGLVGAHMLTHAALGLAAATGNMPLVMFAGARYTQALLLSAAVPSLLTYMVFLYTGSRRAALPLGVAYVAVAAVSVWHITLRQPVGVVGGRWTADVAFANPGLPGVFPVLALAYALPIVVAGLLYLRIAAGLAESDRRRRAALLGIGLIVWTATGFLSRMDESDAWQFVTRVGLAFVVAALFLASQRTMLAPEERAARHEERMAALTERARRLL